MGYSVLCLRKQMVPSVLSFCSYRADRSSGRLDYAWDLRRDPKPQPSLDNSLVLGLDDEDHCAGRCILVESFATPATYVETSCCDTSLATAAPYTSNVGEQMQPSSTQPSGWLWTRNTLCSSRWESSFLLARDRVSPGSLQQRFASLDTRASSYQRTILTDAYLLWCGKLRGDSLLKACGTLSFWD